MVCNFRGLSKKLYLVADDRGSEASFEGLWVVVFGEQCIYSAEAVGQFPIINLLSMLDTVAIPGYNSAALDH